MKEDIYIYSKANKVNGLKRNKIKGLMSKFDVN